MRMKGGLLSFLSLLFYLISATCGAPLPPSTGNVSKQERRISSSLMKWGVGALFAGTVAAAFLEATHLSNQANAPPSEGAFTDGQEKAISEWFDNQPTEIWQGDQIIERLGDTPNVSKKEMGLFNQHWEARKKELQRSSAAPLTAPTHAS